MQLSEKLSKNNDELTTYKLKLQQNEDNTEKYNILAK